MHCPYALSQAMRPQSPQQDPLRKAQGLLSVAFGLDAKGNLPPICPYSYPQRALQVILI